MISQVSATLNLPPPEKIVLRHSAGRETARCAPATVGTSIHAVPCYSENAHDGLRSLSQQKLKKPRTWICSGALVDLVVFTSPGIFRPLSVEADFVET